MKTLLYSILTISLVVGMPAGWVLDNERLVFASACIAWGSQFLIWAYKDEDWVLVGKRLKYLLWPATVVAALSIIGSTLKPGESTAVVFIIIIAALLALVVYLLDKLGGKINDRDKR